MSRIIEEEQTPLLWGTGGLEPKSCPCFASLLFCSLLPCLCFAPLALVVVSLFVVCICAVYICNQVLFSRNVLMIGLHPDGMNYFHSSLCE